MPHAAIGVDVITGFPGETEAHFAETQQFLVDLPVSYLHVFSYSERPNTTAIRRIDVVEPEERLRRTNKLRLLSEKKKRAFCLEHQGTTRKVLWEVTEDGVTGGYTDNYIRVESSDAATTNQIDEVVLEHLNGDNIFDKVKIAISV
ncbi:MAG: hypothetical protein JNM00_10125 [Flavobacteriales bacterium]|nr:hypothetical protein [Flavobacteriales bacterium]